MQDEFRKFKDLNNFPYNSTDPYDFKSQFVAGLDKKHYCSARRYSAFNLEWPFLVFG